MAIKGKSRSRGAKAVTRGPKPAYVPVRTPLLRRRGLWISLAVIVGVAAVVGVAIGLSQERNRDREEDLRARMAAAVGRYRQQIDPILATFGQPLPPTGFDAYPNLAQALDGVAADEVEPETLQSAETEAKT